MKPTTPQLDLFPAQRGRPCPHRLFRPIDNIADALDLAAEEAGHLRILIDAPILLPAHRTRIREAARTIEQQTRIALNLVNLYRHRG